MIGDCSQLGLLWLETLSVTNLHHPGTDQQIWPKNNKGDKEEGVRVTLIKGEEGRADPERKCWNFFFFLQLLSPLHSRVGP